MLGFHINQKDHQISHKNLEQDCNVFAGDFCIVDKLINNLFQVNGTL